jgi:hypothetical protein
MFFASKILSSHAVRGMPGLFPVYGQKAKRLRTLAGASL